MVSCRFIHQVRFGIMAHSLCLSDSTVAGFAWLIRLRGVLSRRLSASAIDFEFRTWIPRISIIASIQRAERLRQYGPMKSLAVVVAVPPDCHCGLFLAGAVLDAAAPVVFHREARLV